VQGEIKCELLLELNKLYLGRTNEFTSTDKYVPMLERRSSTGMLTKVKRERNKLWTGYMKKAEYIVKMKAKN
jgi:hypothetical protein